VRSLQGARERATQRISAAFDRLPIRTRLAGVSALLTFVILCSFALVVGSLTVHRIRSDFDRQVAQTAEELTAHLNISLSIGRARVVTIEPSLSHLALPEHSAIKILSLDGSVLTEEPKRLPSLGAPQSTGRTAGGYLVYSHLAVIRSASTQEQIGEVIVQYGRRVSDVDATIARVELLLLLGVFAGTGLALLAGAMIARRAMQPIAELTRTAAQIARTRDPSASVPQPAAEDEVGELARTLSGMLHALDDAHAETEAMLARQRRFVADASHELRTPLTSVLANLELLAESLQGEQGEAASSALRSSRRMRRLVADLLLLARSDVGRVVPREPVDLARIVVEASAELGPVSGDHEIVLEIHPAVVQGVHDELFRLTLNLIENALRHTPAGTEIRVSCEAADGYATLIVQDNGPGVAEELRASLFERFVRGSGDRGGSFGLGLAIVRAVAESHGGTVALEPALRGARFVVRVPLAEGLDLDDDREHHRAAAQAVID
jgi:signal transduction histidine kinase